MYGMVTALVIKDRGASAADSGTVAAAARAAGSSAFACRIA
jgi:hypothetical protein